MQEEKGRLGGSQLTETVGDGELIARVRGGDTEAFEILFQRHQGVALLVARKNSDNASDAEDAVSEAFSSVFQSLREGKGPDSFFRAYLLTVITRVARRRNVAAGRVAATDDELLLDQPVQSQDTVLAEFENDAVSHAFKSLPERWQAVLWYLDIEGMKPAAAAPLLGLSANAVSALALRARDGLRKEYLQNHVRQTTESDPCSPYASKLGAYAMHTLRRSSRLEVKAHLDDCLRCTAALLDLSDVGAAMKAFVLPGVVGFGFAEWLSLSPAAAGAGKLALAWAPVKSMASAGVSQLHGLGAFALTTAAGVVISAAVATTAVATSGFGAWKEPTPQADEPVGISVSQVQTASQKSSAQASPSSSMGSQASEISAGASAPTSAPAQLPIATAQTPAQPSSAPTSSPQPTAASSSQPTATNSPSSAPSEPAAQATTPPAATKTPTAPIVVPTTPAAATTITGTANGSGSRPNHLTTVSFSASDRHRSVPLR